ncbi:hypothetical protein AB1K62_07065 [Parasphingorhabdus sp. JC815]|uniref:hypothetical protein n=1 Tax=Parasphingorhabdus sp. JC815 TaxID=3232140 RepID=UPI0034585592
MTELISANWLFFLIAIIIGVATAFWIWAKSGRDNTADQFNADDGLLDKAGKAVPTAPPAPKAEPAPVRTEPKAAPTTPAPTPSEPVAKPAVVPAPSPVPTPTAAPAPTPRRKQPVTETPPPPPGKPDIPPAVGEPDNLRLIKGVGPKLNTLLNDLGITRFDQIAEWKEAEIEEVDKYLGSFSGRITRDSWIGQAKFLAKDDIAGFEQKYGKL